MKRIHCKCDGLTIFDIDYLREAVLTDKDLDILLADASLNRSLIYAQFVFNGSEKKPEEVFDECKKDKAWFDTNTCTVEKQDAFRNILAKVYKNIYYYSEKRCLEMADMWLLNFGFRCIHE